MMRKTNTNARARASLSSTIDNYRIFILFFLVFGFMAIFAPNFLNGFNMTSIMKNMAMNACVAIGFTVIMICGQLDLSIGTVITLAGVVGLGLKQYLGYGGSIPVAIITGALIGLINGLLVVKAKINSFIVTLGTMTLLTGIIYQATGGNSISLSSDDAFRAADFLQLQLMPLLTPRVIITLLLIAAAEFYMQRTKVGRNFYMVGGNTQTAWLAGINTDAYLIGAFMLSGLTAAIGGVLFAVEGAAATLKLGDTSLMYVISATIIGGTAMSGGKGGIFRTFVAILMLEFLFNGIILFGLGNEVKIFLSGVILAAVVLYEAYATYRHDLTVGARPELVKESVRLRASERG